jgi:pSer/pThr/pTyr-binding forkhead associated (FHA) protein
MGIRRELEVYSGSNKLQTFVIRKRKVQLGNKITKAGQETNDITLEDDKIARRHAQITQEGHLFVIKNLHKDHSTVVNGKSCVKKEIKDKDEIVIGPYRIIFREVKEVNWVPIIAAAVVIILIGVFLLVRETSEEKFDRALSILESQPPDAMAILEDLENKLPDDVNVKFHLAKAYFQVGYQWQNNVFLSKAEDKYEELILVKEVADDPEFTARIEEGLLEVKTYRIELKKQQAILEQ